jgi:hypothetical protein
MCQKLLIFGVINPIQPNTAQDLLWQLFSFISLQSEMSTFNDLTNLFFLPGKYNTAYQRTCRSFTIGIPE